MFLILVLGAVLAVSVPGAMQGQSQSLAVGLEVPGVPCAHCSGSWVGSSLLTDTLCSQYRAGEPGREGRFGTRMLGSCWIKSFAATVQGFCRLVVSVGFFFPLNTRRNSGRNINLGFILVFFSRKNLDGKKHVLDKLPMPVS